MHILDGMICRVNLTTQEVSFEPSKQYLELFPGGRGINQYILLKEIRPGTCPLEPANVIAFGAGLLAGTPVPAAVRLNADSLNVYTGGIGSSNCGGDFAPELRRAGIDHIVIKGRSEKPVYLWIHDGKVEIKDASHLWGKGVFETNDAIKAEVQDPEAHVLCIGPAGENLSRPACIMVDKHRALARCGLGAVMGSKRLKAVAVRGTGSIETENPEALAAAIEKITRMLAEDDFNALRTKYGVYCYAPWTTDSPYRNFQGVVPGDRETRQVSPEAFLPYKMASKSCGTCPIRCWAIHEIDTDRGKLVCEALQGNDPHNFGAKLNLFDVKTILEAHALCNDLGLDEDNVCGVIAWAFECYEKGIISHQDADGLFLKWGDRNAVFELITKIAYREGFGDILAEGSLRASQILGGSEFSIHIKGQELMESLWTKTGWALGTVVSARGGTHTRGAVQEGRLAGLSNADAPRIFGIPYIPKETDYGYKEKLVAFYERLQAMLDCLGICYFTNSGRADSLMPVHYAELVSLATGWQYDENRFMEVGEKVHCLEKCFNVLHRGWTRKDDYPPSRFMEQPVQNGPAAGTKLDEVEWGRMLDRYYELHGWDVRTGWPKRETLVRLGLAEVADILERWNKLPG